VPLRVVRLERWSGVSLALGGETTDDSVVIDDLESLVPLFRTIAQADRSDRRHVGSKYSVGIRNYRQVPGWARSEKTPSKATDYCNPAAAGPGAD